MGSATTMGTTIDLSSGSFFVSYQVDLGQMLIAIFLAAILLVMILRWAADWAYRR